MWRATTMCSCACRRICGSDLHILSVPPGHPATAGTILGHEYVAEVEQAGPAAAAFRPGDRVVIDQNLTCGQCPYCRMGRPNSCLNMTTREGIKVVVAPD